MRREGSTIALAVIAGILALLATLPWIAPVEAQSSSVSPWYRSGTAAIVRSSIAQIRLGAASLNTDGSLGVQIRTNGGSATQLSAGFLYVGNSFAAHGCNSPCARLEAVAFALLGTPSNGSIVFCSDCTIANPCAGVGTGALAKRLNGVWVCN